MSTRQYIGARYVPKFADPIEWDNARSYEALEIVTYLGTSYTSKKPVPVGTAITNTEYWVATGNYNAQVEAYRQEVETVAEQSKEMVRDARKYRNIILIGDSYGTNNGGGVTIDTPFPTVVAQFLGYPAGRIHSAFQNGAGFGNGAFTSLLNSVISGLTEEQKESITDVCFFGGWNDEANRVTHDQFIAGVSACEALISANFPHAVKSVWFWSNTRVSWHANLYTTRGWYAALSGRGWGCNMGMYAVLIPPEFVISDGAHPSQDGVNALAGYFVNYILAGTYTLFTRNVYALSNLPLEDGIVSNFGGTLTNLIIDVMNDVAHLLFSNQSNNSVIKFQSDSVDTPRSITFNGSEIKIGQYTTNVFAGATTNAFINVPICALLADSSTMNFTAQIMLRESGVYLKLPYLVGTGYTPETKSVAGFVIGAGQSTIPNEFI